MTLRRTFASFFSDSLAFHSFSSPRLQGWSHRWHAFAFAVCQELIHKHTDSQLGRGVFKSTAEASSEHLESTLRSHANTDHMLGVVCNSRPVSFCLFQVKMLFSKYFWGHRKINDIAWKLFICFEPNPSSWNRVLSKNTFDVNEYFLRRVFACERTRRLKTSLKHRSVKNFLQKAMVLGLQMVQLLSTWAQVSCDPAALPVVQGKILHFLFVCVVSRRYEALCWLPVLQLSLWLCYLSLV